MTELESAIRETVEGILTPEIVEKARDMALQCANANEITEIVGRSLDGTEEGGADPPSGRTGSEGGASGGRAEDAPSRETFSLRGEGGSRA
jgi:hypothetical protein